MNEWINEEKKKRKKGGTNWRKQSLNKGINNLIQQCKGAKTKGPNRPRETVCRQSALQDPLETKPTKRKRKKWKQEEKTPQKRPRRCTRRSQSRYRNEKLQIKWITAEKNERAESVRRNAFGVQKRVEQSEIQMEISWKVSRKNHLVYALLLNFRDARFPSENEYYRLNLNLNKASLRLLIREFSLHSFGRTARPPLFLILVYFFITRPFRNRDVKIWKCIREKAAKFTRHHPSKLNDAHFRMNAAERWATIVF